MKSPVLTLSMSSADLSGYTAAVTIFLLAGMFCCLLLMGRDFSRYRESREAADRVNALLWAAGAAMALFSLLFILTENGLFLGLVTFVGFAVVYSSVGNGIRNQLNRY